MQRALKILLGLLLPVVVGAKHINTATVSGTWFLSGSPYYIENDIEVPDDSVLVIEPGVVVVFQGHYKLQVNGAIIAGASGTQPILFKPADTALGWRGIQMDNSGLGANGKMSNNDSSKFLYCQFEYARNTGDNYYRGAALYIREFSKLQITNCTFRNNYSMITTPADGSGKGAGLFLRDTRVPVNNCLFEFNHVADDGGALYAVNAGVISHCIFRHNTAYEDGGAIAVFDGAILQNCIIDSNEAITEEGGGVYAEDGAVLINCTVTNNSAGQSGNGGGLYLLEKCRVENCIVNGNTAGKLGGGILTVGSTTVLRCIIRSNQADEGGGIAYSSGANTTLPGNLVYNCIVQDNRAKIAGGIKGYYGYFVNCLITNNTATQIGGGFRGQRCHIINTTIAANESANTGGLSSKSHNTVTNTVIWNNTEPQVTEDFAGLAIHHSAIDGVTAGNYPGNIPLSASALPGFKASASFIGASSGSNTIADIVSANWSLAQTATLINRGENSTYDPALAPYDIDSNTRIQHGTIDIGCYESEYQGVSVPAVNTTPMDLSIHYDPAKKILMPLGNFSYGTLKVISVNGSLVEEYKVFPGDVLSIDNYPAGILVAIMEANGHIITRRIIK